MIKHTFSIYSIFKTSLQHPSLTTVYTLVQFIITILHLCVIFVSHIIKYDWPQPPDGSLKFSHYRWYWKFVDPYFPSKVANSLGAELYVIEFCSCIPTCMLCIPCAFTLYNLIAQPNPPQYWWWHMFAWANIK